MQRFSYFYIIITKIQLYIVLRDLNCNRLFEFNSDGGKSSPRTTLQQLRSSTNGPAVDPDAQKLVVVATETKKRVTVTGENRQCQKAPCPGTVGLDKQTNKTSNELRNVSVNNF